MKGLRAVTDPAFLHHLEKQVRRQRRERGTDHRRVRRIFKIAQALIIY